MRILIAEDDVTSRLALSGVLTNNGHQVVETVNGAEAWAILQQSHAPRFIILDWMMPEMDGLELLCRIRHQPATQSAYVILLTARGKKADIVAGLKAGANDYLVKPFDAGELLARIDVGCRLIDMQAMLATRMDELKKSEEKYRILLERSSDAIFSCTPEGQVEYVNQAFAQEVGASAAEIVGRPIGDVFPDGTADPCLRALHQVRCTGEESVVERCARGKDRRRYLLTTVTPVKDGSGRIVSLLCSSKDITERRRLETYREMGREILQVLNEPDRLTNSLQRVLALLKQRTGFDAVGIRLQEGEDFPYVAHQGFSPEFYQQENTLIGHTPNGEVCRGSNGQILLECTCGLVISGAVDPNDPLCTPGGSFWTNDSQPLLRLSSDRDPRFRPRNQCMLHDYASIALIPLRNKEQIVGLLQFCSTSKNCFTREAIEALEGIASHIGAALTRKQAEEALQEQGKQVKDIIEFLPDATLAIDRQGRVIIWNKAMESMTGLPAETMIGKGSHAYAVPFYGHARPQLVDLILADDAGIEALYPHIVREGDTLLTEVYCEHLYQREGAWVFAKASPLRDQEGTVVGAIESIRDVTYKKRMEEQLKQNIAWFEALFNATSDSVILIRPDGTILDLNTHAANRRHLGKKAMRGRNLFDFLPPESAALRREAIARILRERTLVQYDEVRQDQHYRLRLFPILDEQGNVTQVASFSRDITESMRAEEEKKKLQAQLIQVQKIEALGTLAGGIAHDFNNILAAILGYAEMAREDAPEGSKACQHLDKVLDAGERATSLVKQILTYSRQNNTDRVPLYPAHIVKETIQLLRPSLPSTITIERQIDATRPILADPTQIQQILINLCVNAFHAMEQAGGVLEISLKDCQFSPQDLLHRPEIRPGDFVELTVRDSGTGIDTEVLGRIFDPYFTTKEVGKGTGMGLSIVLGLVTSYGGFIICDSEAGQGAAFRVFFPACDLEAAEESVSPPSPLSGQGHILFVDDEEMIADLGRTMLEHLGYQVTTLTSSVQALTLFQLHPDRFDAVITDQTMPGMTGGALAERLLQIRPEVPIILCTGYSNLITEDKARSLGIKGFVMKPFSQQQLAELLRHVLEGRGGS
jgi:PAS domain S-box-containing protein